MKLKTELTKIAAQHGAKAGGYKTTWDEIRTLGLSYGVGAVATDFAAFMGGGLQDHGHAGKSHGRNRRMPPNPRGNGRSTSARQTTSEIPQCNHQTRIADRREDYWGRQCRRRPKAVPVQAPGTETLPE